MRRRRMQSILIFFFCVCDGDGGGGEEDDYRSFTITWTLNFSLLRCGHLEFMKDPFFIWQLLGNVIARKMWELWLYARLSDTSATQTQPTKVCARTLLCRFWTHLCLEANQQHILMQFLNKIIAHLLFWMRIQYIFCDSISVNMERHFHRLTYNQIPFDYKLIIIKQFNWFIESDWHKIIDVIISY